MSSKIHNQLLDLIEDLGGRETRVLQLRNGFNDSGEKKTLHEIGVVFFGLSKERVRQIEMKSLYMLGSLIEKQKNRSRLNAHAYFHVRGYARIADVFSRTWKRREE